jgi:hypothetical protein
MTSVQRLLWKTGRRKGTSRLRAQGSGLRAQGSGLRAQGIGHKSRKSCIGSPPWRG